MKLDRKLFWRTLWLFAVVDACLLLTACGDWESQAINIINLLVPAVTAAVQILVAFGAGVSPSAIEKFDDWAKQTENGLMTLKSLILQIKNSTGADTSGIVSQIKEGIDVVASQLQTILPELHVTNPETQARIMAAFAAISGFLTALISLLPAIKPQATVAEAHAAATQAKVSVAQFKHDFNQAAGYFGKQYEI
jgi:outer membrane lipopolysaccharide assembly protein LptE/RlpB